MHLGAFSVSLTVKDLGKSAAFYEALGFEAFHGTVQDGWMMLRQGDTVIGLFCGMFEKNTLTFNPGWTQAAEPVGAFKDVRDIQKALKAKGIEIVQSCDESTTGPAHIVLSDPDGNPVLIDQHV